MATLQNRNIVYGSGEALPAVGSAEYNLAQKDPQGYASFKSANPSLIYTNEDEAHFQNVLSQGNTGGYQTITSDMLRGNVAPLTLSPKPVTSTADAISGSTDATLSNVEKTLADQAKSAETKATISRTNLEDTMNEILGVQKSRSTLESEASIPELAKLSNETFTALQASKRAQEKEVKAVMESFGGTTAGAQDAISAINRKYAFEQADLAIAYDVANRNFANAQSTVDRKIQLTLEPLQTKYDFQKTFYENNREAFTKAEDRQFQQMIDKSKRELDRQEKNGDAIKEWSGVAIKAGQGSLAKELSSLDPSSETFNDDLGAIISRIEDPTMKLDIELKRAELAYKQRQAELLGEPTAAEKKATAAALKEAKSSVPVMKDKIAIIDSLTSHSGLNTRVGTSILSRKAKGLLGSAGKTLTVVGIPGQLFGDVPDKFSGAGQDFAGGVHKLVGGLTLQSLIDAKARGATFGALSEGELNILANSASAINDWEFKDSNGKGIGIWNIDEASFKRELNTIKTLTNRALSLSGNLISDDEDALLDSTFSSQNTATTSDYFNN